MDKVYIIGSVASGKTTLAKKLSFIRGIKYYELDNIVHDDTKKTHEKRSIEEQEEIINKINEESSWIIEGTYRKSAHLILDLADKIIFLDTPVLTRKVRILTRFIKQKLHIEKCNYKANLSMLKLMYMWTDSFEERREELESMLSNDYNRKLILLRNKKEMESFIKKYIKKDG